MGLPSRDTLFGRLLRLPLSLLSPDAEVRILRGPLRGKKWVAGAGPHGYWAGTYEPARLRAFAASIAPGSTVYDIGANVGIYSLLASSCVGPPGRVYAFEPLDRNLRYLRRNLQINGVQNCVIFEGAVSNAEGRRRFSADDWEPSMSRLSSKGEIEVRATTLDNSIYGDKSYSPPVALKIDVEGAELEVLEGADRSLAEFHPIVFLETHGGNLHAQCRSLLESKGYRIEESIGQLIARP